MANPGLPQLKTTRFDFNYTASSLPAPSIFESERIRIIPLELDPIPLTTALLQHILNSSLGTQPGILQVVLNVISQLIDKLNLKRFESEPGYITNFRISHTNQHGGQESTFDIHLKGMKEEALA
jgi:hypothetical protein